MTAPLDPKTKYQRKILSVEGKELEGSVDVYSVLKAFNVQSAPRAHAIKKLLCAGIRGKGDVCQDLREAIVAIERDVVESFERIDSVANQKEFCNPAIGVMPKWARTAVFDPMNPAPNTLNCRCAPKPIVPIYEETPDGIHIHHWGVDKVADLACEYYIAERNIPGFKFNVCEKYPDLYRKIHELSTDETHSFTEWLNFYRRVKPSTKVPEAKDKSLICGLRDFINIAEMARIFVKTEKECSEIGLVGGTPMPIEFTTELCALSPEQQKAYFDCCQVYRKLKPSTQQKESTMATTKKAPIKAAKKPAKKIATKAVKKPVAKAKKAPAKVAKKPVKKSAAKKAVKPEPTTIM